MNKLNKKKKDIKNKFWRENVWIRKSFYFLQICSEMYRMELESNKYSSMYLFYSPTSKKCQQNGTIWIEPTDVLLQKSVNNSVVQFWKKQNKTKKHYFFQSHIH